MDVDKIKNLPETYFRRVEFTSRLGCSVACTFCPQKPLMEATKGEERILTKENVAAMIENMKDSVLTEVHFSGFTEPFLNPDMPEFIRMVHEAGLDVKIFSTLKGLTQEALDRIKDIPIKLFHVSLQPKGMSTRPGLDDDTAWAQLDMLLNTDHKFNLRFGCVDVGIDKDRKEEFEKLCSDRNISPIYGEYLDRAGNLPEGKHGEHEGKSHLICTRNIGFVVLPNGDCCWCSMDYGTQHRIGNLLKQKYNEILVAEPVQKMLRSMDGSGEVENLLCHTCESAYRLNNVERAEASVMGRLFPTKVKTVQEGQ